MKTILKIEKANINCFDSWKDDINYYINEILQKSKNEIIIHATHSGFSRYISSLEVVEELEEYILPTFEVDGWQVEGIKLTLDYDFYEAKYYFDYDYAVIYRDGEVIDFEEGKNKINMKKIEKYIAEWQANLNFVEFSSMGYSQGEAQKYYIVYTGECNEALEKALKKFENEFTITEILFSIFKKKIIEKDGEEFSTEWEHLESIATWNDEGYIGDDKEEEMINELCGIAGVKREDIAEIKEVNF